MAPSFLRLVSVLLLAVLPASQVEAAPSPAQGQAVLFYDFYCNDAYGYLHLTSAETNFCGLWYSCPYWPFIWCPAVNDNTCSVTVGPQTRLQLLRHCAAGSEVVFDYHNTDSGAVCIGALDWYSESSYAVITVPTPEPVPNVQECGWEESFPCMGDSPCTHFSDSSVFSTPGSTSLMADGAQLYPPQTGKAGALWFKTPVNVRSSFTTEFSFTIRSNGGSLYPPGADGLAFVIQGQGQDALGYGGGNMGFAGLSSAVVVEFDTWYNDWTPSADPYNNHIAILAYGLGVEASASHSYSLAQFEFPDSELETSTKIFARVSYLPTSSGSRQLKVECWLDQASGTPYATVQADVTLDGVMALPYGSAWVGFTGATGANFQDTRLRSWKFSTAGPRTSASVLELSGTGLISEVRFNDPSPTFGIRVRAECGGGYFADQASLSVSCGTGCSGSVYRDNTSPDTSYYTASLSFTAAGTYTVHVSYNDGNAAHAGSEQFTVVVKPTDVAYLVLATDAASSTFSVTAGGQATVRALAYDASNNRVLEAAQGKVVSALVSPSGAGASVVSATHEGNGVYAFVWSGQLASSSGLSIAPTVDGVVAAGSTSHALTVAAGAFSLDKSTVSVGESRILAGAAPVVTLALADAYGNPIASAVGGGVAFTARLDPTGATGWGDAVSKSCPMSFSAAAGAYTTLAASCQLTATDTFTVRVEASSSGAGSLTALDGPSTVRVCPNTAVDMEWKVESLSVAVGETKSRAGFFIDAHGNRLRGGFQCCKQLTGTECQDLQYGFVQSSTTNAVYCESRDNGKYRCWVTADDVAGEYSLGVRAVPGNAQYTLPVTVTAGSPASLAVSVDHPSVAAGGYVTATVQVLDARGNAVAGDFEFGGALDCTASAQCDRAASTPMDSAQRVQATVTGQYSLRVFLDDLSASAAVVVTAGAPDAAQSVVSGTLLQGGVAGSQLAVRADLRDAYGNVVSGAAVSDVTVLVTNEADGADFPSVALAVASGSAVDGTVTPTKATAYTVEVRVRGARAAIADSRVTPGALRLSQSTVLASSLVLPGVVGQRHEYSFQARDQYGNALTTDAASTTLCVQATRATLSAGVEANQDGTYTVALTFSEAGAAQVSVGVMAATAGSSSSSSSSCSFTAAESAGSAVDRSLTLAAGPISAAQSCVVWGGLSSCDTQFLISLGAAETETTVGVLARDAYGNVVARSAQAAQLTAEATATELGSVGSLVVPSPPAADAATASNAYAFQLQARRELLTSGLFVLRVYHAGALVSGRGFSVSVQAGELSAAHSVLSGPATVAGFKDEPTYVLVTARDTFNATRTVFGSEATGADNDASAFQVTVENLCTGETEQVSAGAQVRPGVYRYSFSFSARTDGCAETYRVSARVQSQDDQDVRGSPRAVEVGGPAISNVVDVAPAADPHVLVAGDDQLELTIQTRDTEGEAFTFGGFDVAVDLRPAPVDGLVGWYVPGEGLANKVSPPSSSSSSSSASVLGSLVDLGAECGLPSSTVVDLLDQSTVRRFEQGTGFAIREGVQDALAAAANANTGLDEEYTVVVRARFERPTGNSDDDDSSSSSSSSSSPSVSRLLYASLPTATGFSGYGWHTRGVAGSTTSSDVLAAVDDEQWHTYALVASRTGGGSARSVSLFLDGELVSSFEPSQAVWSSGLRLSAGFLAFANECGDVCGCVGATGASKAGHIASVMVYDRALRASELSWVRSAVTDAGDGTYTSVATPTLAGWWEAQVSVEGALAATLSVMVQPSAVVSPALSSVVAVAGPVVAGSPATAVVDAVDAFGNSLAAFLNTAAFAPHNADGATPAYADAATFSGAATMAGAPAHAFAVTMAVVATTDGDGAAAVTTFTGSFTPAKAGTWSVAVSSKGSAIANSPATVAVVPAAADVANSLVAGQGVVSGVAGELATFTLLVKDAHGNQRSCADYAGVEDVVAATTVPATADGVAVRCEEEADGGLRYALSYVPTVATTHRVQLTLNGAPKFEGEGAAVSVTFGPFSAARSTVLNCTGAVQAGQVGSLFLQAVDAYGNTITTGGERLAAAVSAGDLSLIAAGAVDYGNGVYRVRYRFDDLLGAQQATVAVTAANTGDGDGNGNALVQDSCDVAVSVAAPSGANVVVTPPAATATAGVAYSFTFQARDAFGNPVVGSTTGYGVSIAPVSGSAGQFPAEASLVLSDSSATHRVRFTAYVARAYSIALTLNGQVVQGGLVTVTCVHTAAHPPSTQFVGAGLVGAVAGEIASFEARLFDQYGNALQRGGDSVAVAITSATLGTRDTASVQDEQSGTYTLSFVLTASGAYTVRPTVNDQLLTASALTVVPAFPYRAVLSDEGLPASVVAGHSHTVQVSMQDEFGNLVTSPPSALGANVRLVLAAAASSSSPALPTVTAMARETGDAGVLELVFSHTAAGTYAQVSLGVVSTTSATAGKTFAAASVSTLVVHPAKADRATSTVEMPEGSLETVAGVPFVYSVVARDAYGNVLDQPTAHADGAVVGVAADVAVDGSDSPANAETSAAWNAATRRFDVAVTLTLAGTFDVASSVSCDGCASGTVGASPASLSVVPAAAHAPSCEASGTGLTGGVASELLPISVLVRDQFGNVRETASDAAAVAASVAPLSADGTAGSPLAPAPQFEYAGAGWSTSAGWENEASGRFSVSVTVGGSAVPGSPFTAVLRPADVSYANSEFTAPTEVVAGESFVVSVLPRDGTEARNVLLYDQASLLSLTVAVPATGVVAQGVVTDDARLRASVVVATAGTHATHVRLDGEDVGASPFDLRVLPAALDAGKTTVAGAGLSAAVAGVQQTLTIVARDQFGNLRSVAGTDDSASLALVLQGDASAVVGSVAPAASGAAATYQVSYTAFLAGTHDISVVVVNNANNNNNNANNVVFEGQLVVSPNVAHAANTVVVSAASSAVAGTNVVFSVTPRDAYKNVVPSDSNSVVLGATLSAGAVSSLSPLADGGVAVAAGAGAGFAVTFRPTLVGSYALALSVNGDDVAWAATESATTPTVDVTFAAASAAVSVLTLETAAAFAGDDGLVAIEAKDSFGNAVLGTDEEFVVTLVEASGAEVPLALAAPAGSGSRYTFAFVPTVSGEHSVRASLGGAAVGGSPVTSSCTAGPAVHAASVFTGEGLAAAVAGAQATFQLLVNDAYGNARSHVVDTVAARAVGPSASYDAAVTSLGAGLYSLAWSPTVANAEYAWTITVGEGEDAVAFGGDRVAWVSPGPLSVPDCLLDASHPGTVVAGDTMSFVVSTYDQYGNRILESRGEGFSVSIALDGGAPSSSASASPVVAEFDDQQDGTYVATSVVTLAAQHVVSVTATSSAQHVGGSPFGLLVTPNVPHSLHTVVDAAAATVVAGEAQQFSVLPFDVYGNDASSTSVDAQVAAVLATTAQAQAQAQAAVVVVPTMTRDEGTGAFVGTYEATVAGSYSLQVTVDGAVLAQAAQGVEVVPAEAHAATSSAEGAGLETAVAGEGASFRVTLFDRFSNLIPSPQAADVAVTVAKVPLPSPAVAAPTVEAAADGASALDVAYNPFIIGDYRLVVLVRGDELVNTTVTVLAAGTHLPNCNVLGSGYYAASSIAGQTLTFSIATFDQYGNERSTGGDAFAVTVASKDDGGATVVPATVLDLATGVYRVSFTPTRATNYSVSVELDGETLHDAKGEAAGAATVRPAATDIQRSVLRGPGARGAVASDAASFVVVAKDRFDNLRLVGGDALFAVLTGPDTLVVAATDVTDHGDGNYTLPYTAVVSGVYSVQLYLGRNLKTPQPSIVVAVGGMEPTMTLASGSGLKGSVAGVEAVVSLQARDAGGNLLGAGGDTFSASLVDPSDDNAVVATAVVTDNEDGTYALRYTTTAAGDFLLVVKGASATAAAAGEAEQNILGGGDDDDQGAGFGVTILPAQLDGSSSQWTLGSTAVGAGELGFGSVTGFDAYGNAQVEGGDLFVVTAVCVSGCAGDDKGNKDGHHDLGFQFVAQEDEDDGQYLLGFEFTQAGRFQVCASVVGKRGDGAEYDEAVGECVEIFVLPGPAHADNCLVALPSASLRAGSAGSVEVTAYDRYGNLRVAPEGYEGDAFDRTSENFIVFVRDTVGYFGYTTESQAREGATYALQFTPYGASPAYSVDVYLGGDRVPGAWTVEVLPAVLSAANSRVVSPDGYQAVAGEPFAVHLVPYDAYNNRIAAAEGDLAADGATPVVDLVGLRVATAFESGDAPYVPLTPVVSLGSADDADYVVTFAQPIAGVYILQCTYDDAEVLGSPVALAVAPAAASADNSYVVSDELRVGTVSDAAGGEVYSVNGTLTFSVQAVDRFGNLLTQAGPSTLFGATVSADGTSSSSSSWFAAADAGKGLFSIEVALGTVAGDVVVSVQLQPEPSAQASGVANSLVHEETVAVAPGEVNAAQSVLSCPLQEVTAGDAFAAAIAAKDSWGNSLQEGGEPFVCTSSRDAVMGVVADNADGTYDVAYSFTVAGAASVACSLGEAGEAGEVGTCALTVVPSVPSAANSLVRGDPAELLAGESQVREIEARDRFDNIVSTAVPGFSFMVDLLRTVVAPSSTNGGGVTTTQELASKARAMFNPATGFYEFSVGNTVAAQYTAVGQLNGATIGTQLSVRVFPAALSPAMSVASDWDFGTYAWAALGRTFSLLLRDAYGNVLLGDAGLDAYALQLQVEVDGAARESEHGTFLDFRNGTVQANINTTVSGHYSVRVLAQGQELQNSPLQWETVPRALFFTFTQAHWGHVSATLQETQPLRFNLTAFDQFGNAIGTHMDYTRMIDIKVDGPFVSAAAAGSGAHVCPSVGGGCPDLVVDYDHDPSLSFDMATGEYLLGWHPVVEGVYRTYVTVLGYPVQGSPYDFEVQPFVCPDQGVRCSDGTCAAAYAQCPGADAHCTEPGTVLCATTGECAPAAQCPCEEGHTRCALTGACVASASECPAAAAPCDSSSSSSLTVQCWDGTCAAAEADCPARPVCPPGHTLCPDMVSCVVDAGACPRASHPDTLAACPSSAPVRCADLTCAVSLRGCPTLTSCPDGGLVCPDGSCASTQSECAVPSLCEGALSVRCPDGSCRAALADCPTQLSCPPALPVRCADLACVASVSECASAPAATAFEACGSADMFRCPDGSCARNVLFCATRTTCPASSPVLCPDGSCRANALECMAGVTLSASGALTTQCPAGYTRCPGGACVAASEDGTVACPSGVVCPATHPVKCPDNQCVASADKCPATPKCPAAAPLRCRDGTCVSSLDACPTTITCPAEAPVLCPDLVCQPLASMCADPDANACADGLARCPGGECVSALALCPQAITCPAGTVRCWDKSCAASLAVCPVREVSVPCPANVPVRCADSSCRERHEDCPTANLCPAELPVKCHDRTCAATVEQCPQWDAESSVCTSGFSMCPSGLCSLSECGTPVTCPATTPFKCLDETCRAHPDDCPPQPVCPPQLPFLCTNGLCAPSRMACRRIEGCAEPSTPVKCPSGECVAHAEQCSAAANPPGMCPPENPVRCHDGNCAHERWRCAQFLCPAGYHRCSDGSCVAFEGDCELPDECPYDDTRITCHDGSCGVDNPYSTRACLPSINLCPASMPELCANGKCVGAPQDCPDLDTGCLEYESKCFDGSCAAECPDPSTDDECVGANEERCADGSCRRLGSCSLLANGCDGDVPYRCANGRCVDSWDDCPPTSFCPEMAYPCEGDVCLAAAVKCPDGTCAASLLHCPQPTSLTAPDFCLTATPIRCADGTCVAAADECTALATCGLVATDAGGVRFQVRCPDGTCQDDAIKCPTANTCPSEFPVRCFNGACAADEGDCMCTDADYECVALQEDGSERVGPNGCRLSAPYRCLDGSCMASGDECPSSAGAGAGQKSAVAHAKRASLKALVTSTHAANGCPAAQPNKCWDGSCVAATPQCPSTNGCPGALPYRCADGQCMLSPAACSASTECAVDGHVRCAVDGSCAASKLDCPAANNCPLSSPVRCANGECVRSGAACDPVSACPAQSPHRCASGLCAASLALCPGLQVCSDGMVMCPQDMVCRESEDACEAALVMGSGGAAACPLVAPLRCPTGECVPSGADCPIATASCPDGEFLCADGACATTSAECWQRLGRCGSGSGSGSDSDPSACSCAVEGEALCFDGRCQEQCDDPLPACGGAKPFRCDDMSCAADAAACEGRTAEWVPSSATSFLGCTVGERLCSDGCRVGDDCADAPAGCSPSLAYTLKPMAMELTVNPLETASTPLKTSGGAYVGEVKISPGSLASYEDPTRPLTLRLAHVADSDVRESRYSTGDPEPTVLGLRDVVSSPVVSLQVVDAGQSGFTQVLRSPIVVDLAFRTVCHNVPEEEEDGGDAKEAAAKAHDPASTDTELCLAVLDEATGEWECRSSSVVELRSGVYRTQISQLSSGSNKMAVLQKPKDKQATNSGSGGTGSSGGSGDSTQVDGGAVSGGVLASAFVLFGGGYAVWRLHRYKVKYRAWKAERRDQEEMVDMGDQLEGKAQLVVNPMFLAQQQILQKRIADVEGEMHHQPHDHGEGEGEGDEEEAFLQAGQSMAVGHSLESEQPPALPPMELENNPPPGSGEDSQGGRKASRITPGVPPLPLGE